MCLRIILNITIAFCFFLIVSCKREYSYEGGTGAVYNFTGSPAACTAAVIKGNYSIGIAMDSTNAVQLMVQVTQPGKYDISTNSIDGISFSLSGNFTDTGMQTIVLPAKGVPDTPGTFQIAIPGTGGCSFSITVAPQQAANYQLSGAPADCIQPDMAGTYITGKTLNDLNKLTVDVDVFATGTYAISTDTVNGIYFAASDYFTAIGNQQVVLQGAGTGNQPGLYDVNIQADQSACNFYLPVQNAEPLAYYVLQSSVISDTLICSPHSIQGIYVTNSAVMRSNTATISIYVAQPGNYTIATNRVNGVMFQYSGTFVNEGAQDVVLFAEGTPTAAGTFLYTAQIVGPATLGGSECGFDVQVQ